MTKLRDRSKINKPKSFASPKDRINKKWTENNKQTLIALLKSGVESAAEIQSYIPKFTLEEVEEFMEDNMKIARAEIEQHADEIEQRADETEQHVDDANTGYKEIGDNWSDILRKLFENVPDYSYQFEDIIRNFQKGVEKTKTAKKTSEPDWHLVYEYIATLFNGNKLPKLGQIEAGIVLMLFEDLLENYDSKETSLQLSICKEKHQLLSSILADGDSMTDAKKQEIINSALDLNILRTTQQQSTNNSTQTNIGPYQVVVVPSGKVKQEEPLYSINPLCIPIPLINPVSKP